MDPANRCTTRSTPHFCSEHEDIVTWSFASHQQRGRHLPSRVAKEAATTLKVGHSTPLQLAVTIITTTKITNKTFRFFLSQNDCPLNSVNGPFHIVHRFAETGQKKTLSPRWHLQGSSYFETRSQPVFVGSPMALSAEVDFDTHPTRVIDTATVSSRLSATSFCFLSNSAQVVVSNTTPQAVIGFRSFQSTDHCELSMETFISQNPKYLKIAEHRGHGPPQHTKEHVDTHERKQHTNLACKPETKE